MPAYIGLVRQEDGSAYGVDFPDFPGCITAGKTLEEASRRAREVLAVHVRGMLKDGEQIPAPSQLDSVMKDPYNRDAVAILVELPSEKARSVRVDITMDEELLEAADAEASRRRMSRSRLIAEAVRHEIGPR